MPEVLKKILIVEDERAIAKPLAMKFEFAGFQVKNAYDGEEALAMMKAEKFDIILLDLMMPKVDGFKVLAEMKIKGITTPVVVASNLDQEADISRVLELGVTNYYVKTNTSLGEIVNNVKMVLNMF
jgi:DNA-binding response OmpR family regulator